MEFGKIEKVDLKDIRIHSASSPLRVKIESLQPGEAVMVSGVERETIESVEAPMKRDGRQFSNRKLGVLKYRVIRLK